MKFMRVGLFSFCLCLVGLTGFAQNISSDSTRPEEIWRQYLETNPSINDLIYLGSDFSEPYRTWAFQKALTYDLGSSHLGDMVVSRNINQEIADLILGAIERLADINLTISAFKNSKNDLIKGKLFNLLGYYDLDAFQLSQLIGGCGEGIRRDKYLEYFWSRFYNLNPDKDSFWTLYTMGCDIKVTEIAVIQLLTCDLTVSQLERIASRTDLTEAIRSEASNRFFAANPSREQLGAFSLSGPEIYAQLAKQMLDNLEPERNQKSELIDLMRSKK